MAQSKETEEKKDTDNIEAKPKKLKKKLKRIKLDILEEGDNKIFAKHGDTVVINYIARFYGGEHHKQLVDAADGKTFSVGKKQVIQGWEEVLTANKMSLGSRAKMKMPHNLCYGYHADIPFAQDMLFEIELLQINANRRVIKPFERNAVVVLEDGDGASFPAKGDYVVMHYEGWFHGGAKHKEKFDSSLDRNKPFGFKIGRKQVSQGWDESVMTLSKGTKAILQIPAAFGYGSKGSPDKTVPKEQDLKIKVQLIDIKSSKK